MPWNTRNGACGGPARPSWNAMSEPATGRSIVSRWGSNRVQPLLPKVRLYWFSGACAYPSPLLQLLPQKRVRQRAHEGGLLVVRCTAVAAFDILVEQHVVAHFQHLRHHLAGVAWMDSVIPRRRREQR